jgi:ABC-type multidrug transport system fused ATPase/permease subunit
MKTQASTHAWINAQFKHTLEESLVRIKPRDRKKLAIILLAQVLLSILDLFSVLLLGLLAALAIGGSSEVEFFPFLSSNTKFNEFMSYDFKSQILILGSLVFIFSTLKIFLSSVLTRKTLYFMARISAETTTHLLGTILNTSMRKVRTYSKQEYIYSVNRGVEILTIQILAATLFLLADLFTLLVLVVLLVFVNWQMTFAIILFYSGMTVLTIKILSRLTKVTGLKLSRYSIKSQELVNDSMNLYEAIWARRAQHNFTDALYRARSDLSRSMANYSFVPYLSKYSIEFSFSLITIFLIFFLFVIDENANSVAIFSLFIATITRILPTILRVQQAILQVKTNLSTLTESLKVFRDFPEDSKRTDPKMENLFEYGGLIPSIQFSNVDFSHNGSDLVLLEKVSFEINPGSLVAIVGASGQGKTSLVNLLLGLLDPSKGTISISGMSPLEAIEAWPGGIAYLPQRTELLNGSIRNNITLSWEHDEDLDTRVFNALEKAQLSQFVAALPLGIDTQIRDVSLSGGELQRLGIARALYTSPKLLILDEPTSALDLKVELNIGRVLEDLRSEITIIAITHTPKFAPNPDLILLVDLGRVIVLKDYSELQEFGVNFRDQ